MSEAKKQSVRKMPMPGVHPRYCYEFSEYPEIIDVSFSDGKVRKYTLADQAEIKQPKPNVIKPSVLMELFEKNTYGGYLAKHAKKETGAEIGNRSSQME
jgi:hypothetical protein